ncbi:MAG: hypothetical protein ACYTDE_09545 [Planctomycetota bacterium]
MVLPVLEGQLSLPEPSVAGLDVELDRLPVGVRERAGDQELVRAREVDRPDDIRIGSNVHGDGPLAVGWKQQFQRLGRSRRVGGRQEPEGRHRVDGLDRRVESQRPRPAVGIVEARIAQQRVARVGHDRDHGGLRPRRLAGVRFRWWLPAFPGPYRIEFDDGVPVGLPTLEVDLERRGVIVDVDLESTFEPSVLVVDRDPAVRLADLGAVSDAEDRRYQSIRGPDAGGDRVATAGGEILDPLGDLRGLTGSGFEPRRIRALVGVVPDRDRTRGRPPFESRFEGTVLKQVLRGPGSADRGREGDQ